MRDEYRRLGRAARRYRCGICDPAAAARRHQLRKPEAPISRNMRTTLAILMVYRRRSVDLRRFIGKTVHLEFVLTVDLGAASYWQIDDVALKAKP